jgi:SNF2 family DNA or RNA helicase
MPAIIARSDYWPEPVAIISTQPDSPSSFVTIEAVGLETRTHYAATLPLQDWEVLEFQKVAYMFDGEARPFRLAIEAERLRLAYTADPLLAANNARVDLLPHQMEAVYGVMLPQPRIRHLMAHDAGAGKTIMGGLLYKELLSRHPDLRTLIVAPAALTRQWQRELRDKFFVDFEIVDRLSLKGDTQVWTSSKHLITSIPFARQPEVRATLANVPWDLVLVDEAHHMAGYEDRETLAYKLGRVLSRNTQHLVLATATPHKGDRENFLKLLQLLDEGIYDPAIVNERAPGQRGNSLMLRRLKEEMVDFDGNPLFKKRQVETHMHVIANNPPEMDLYKALTEYINDIYGAAERIGGATKTNTQFAMVILQRRMASSFAALKQSLLNRQNSLILSTEAEPTAEFNWVDIEEEFEDVRWQTEAQAEQASPSRTRAEREKEIAELGRLLAMLDAVHQTGRETKVEKLREIIAGADITPDSGEKLLVFTESKDTLLFLRGLFESWNFTVTQIDGSMSQEKRLQAEDDFRQRCQIMVATEAAGEGINLQFCAHMINYDLPWVPTRLEQRMGRIHRYGQKRVARIFNLAAADTREGQVLIGLLERLDEMRIHLGDQVYDVISTLVSDKALEQLMAQVATADIMDDAHEHALRQLRDVVQQGKQRRDEWEQPAFAISEEEFVEMKEASRQSRLTPEYAQHFFVDALGELHETPTALPEDNQTREPGDAVILSLAIIRSSIARLLGLPVKRSQVFTFRRAGLDERPDATYLAIGTPIFDQLLAMAEERWTDALHKGAKFIDLKLAPGEAYLLWFLATQVRDGRDQPVEEQLIAIRQTPQAMQNVPASRLLDLAPTDEPFLVPDLLRELAQKPQPTIDWSIEHVQLPWLEQIRRRRAVITELRREPMLHDAAAAEHAAQEAYADAAFTDDDTADTERQLERAQERLRMLQKQYDREAACSLGSTRVIGLAAVFSLVGEPEEELVDERPRIADAAMRHVVKYEQRLGRATRDVSGEHTDYPYDLHSSGPGGVRCIEVKGATSGGIFLTETEQRAAQRLRDAYYLYIVRDPLAEHPHLTIVRDPWAKMTHDNVLHSGVRYLYNPATWQAAADEETTL